VPRAAAPIDTVARRLQEPTGVTTAPDGRVFFTDEKAGLVYVLGASSNASARVLTDRIKRPTGIVWDALGSLFVSASRWDRTGCFQRSRNGCRPASNRWARAGSSCARRKPVSSRRSPRWRTARRQIADRRGAASPCIAPRASVSRVGRLPTWSRSPEPRLLSPLDDDLPVFEPHVTNSGKADRNLG
jgi:hypothetical protein